jgi:hypothetical protein
VTDVALRIAARGIAADADLRVRRLVAHHVAVAGEPRPRGAAAVAVFPAEVAVHAAPRRGLADGDPRRTVRCAEPAAATAAVVTRRAVDLAAAVARPRRRRRARTGGRARRDVADLGAAIRSARA